MAARVCCSIVDIWSKGLQPGQGWDILAPSPILLRYFQEGKIPSGRALVPGCGRGYDVALLAASDRYVEGLEISEVAVKAAEDYIDAEIAAGKPIQKEHLKFRLQNFFDLPVEDKYDFVYDYTFLCALDPSIREDWAKKMAGLVKPNGLLMTVIFPIWQLPPQFEVDKQGDLGSMLPANGPRPDSGPPFKVSLEVVKQLLEPLGFECEELRMLTPEESHPGRDGGGDGLRPYSGVGMWRKK